MGRRFYVNSALLSLLSITKRSGQGHNGNGGWGGGVPIVVPDSP